MKIAAIDIGSNSVRLAFTSDGKTLYKRLETTRLGEGLSFTGAMKERNMERTARAVSDFYKIAQNDGADKVYAFATAAVRSSSNREEFLSRVKRLCGIEVEVLSGEAEARCGILGALRGRDGGIIDVGGASTEVTVQRGGKVLYGKSVNLGAVRLYDLAGRDWDKLNKVISGKLTEYGDYTVSRHYVATRHFERSREIPTIEEDTLPVYAIGGTATTLASVKHALKVYDPAITDGTILTQAEVYALAQKLLSLTVEEVRAVDGMEPRRADVIGGGCLLLASVMQKFGVPQITVSESDNLEGYIYLKEGER